MMITNKEWLDIEHAIINELTKAVVGANVTYLVNSKVDGVKFTYINKEDGLIQITTKYWDRNKDIEVLGKNILAESVKNSPSLSGTTRQLNDVDSKAYYKMESNINIPIPLKAERFILDGDMHKLTIGSPLDIQMTLSWTGDLPDVYKSLNPLLSLLLT